jgi:hypothetical protein
MFSCVCNKQKTVPKVVSCWLNLQDLEADQLLKLEQGTGMLDALYMDL